MTPAVGSRVQVVGNTGSGKSTLAAELAATMGAPLVELDALNWLPGWVGLNETDPARLATRIAEATAGPAWVVAGNYRTFTVEALWPRLDTLIWLDLPLRVVLPRIVARSWQRDRSGELLWGTNREQFWPHLRVWRDESLFRWAITQHQVHRSAYQRLLSEPRWQGIRVMRLRSTREVAQLRSELDVAGASRARAPG